MNSIFDEIKKGENEKVKQHILEVGVNACDGYLRTALIWSTFYDNSALLKWLIENGATINQQDRAGYTALHFAGQEKRYDCAELLIDKGANLELTDIHGNTPLWTAVFNARGDMRLVKLYIQHGANLDHVNNHQRTPRQMLETFGGINS